MRYSKALVAILNADNELTTLLEGGEETGVKIYPMAIPQQVVAPAAAFHLVANVPQYTKASGLPPTLSVKHEESVVQIDIVARTVKELYAIAERMRKVLEFYRGVAADRKVRNILVLEEMELYDHKANEYRYVIQIEMVHREAT